MKFIKLITLVFATFFTLNAMARSTVPVVNYDNVVVATSSGKALQSNQVKQAIQAAATDKGWTIDVQTDGKLLAKLVVRNKHTIMVEIAYTADKYSLNYQNSVNMKYETRDGQPMIHPYYNDWVRIFKDAIDRELHKL